jgi:hypothetical protein
VLVGIIAADDLLGVLADGLRDLARLVAYQRPLEAEQQP